jgi:ribonuclease HI
VRPQNWLHPADSIETREPIEKQPTLQIFTDGSRSEHGVGSGVAIFVENERVRKLKFKLDVKCSNNQAEQLAIIKVLEAIQDTEIKEDTPRTAEIYTDSQITIDSITNTSNHNNLIEEIRKNVLHLQTDNQKIGFAWVKAHVGILGNELADHLARSAVRDGNLQVCYDRILKSNVLRELEEISVTLWEREWRLTPKGEVTKSFFPTVKERLKVNVSLTSNVTTLLTGHGKLRSYFHRFKVLDNPTCPCGTGQQNVDHIIYECLKFATERTLLVNSILNKGGKWPTTKCDLIQKYKIDFIHFTNQIDLDTIQ